MPKPSSGENKKDFISRCIPIVISEGTTKDPKQAAAICYSIWRKHHPGAKSYEPIMNNLSEIKDVLYNISLELSNHSPELQQEEVFGASGSRDEEPRTNPPGEEVLESV